MKLPITGWNKTLKALGHKVVWSKPIKRKRDLLNDQQQYEALEPRQLLAGDTGLTVQADLSQVLATVDDPLVARLGQFDRNASQDLAVISASGQLTVATNGGDGTWQTRQTVDLGTGPLQGMELSLVNDDLFADLILQGPDDIFVALNDGQGNFAVSQTLTPLAAGALGSASGDPLRLITGDLDGDFTFDIAAIAPGTDQVVVYLGVGDGTFGSPSIFSTGGSSPTSITSGDFVRDALPDLAVGHSDGSVSFLQNEGDGLFTLRTDLARTGFSPITDLASGDVDQDGDADIVVASGDDLVILQNGRVEAGTEPVLTNGTFGRGLSTWNVEVVGQPNETVAGTVIAQSGFAQLIENQSFLVSINQPFVVPAAPEKIEVDILSLGLENPNGGVPDAFEISILDADGNSLVPTFRPDATSFFNANPSATTGGDELISLANGVTFDGRTVSVDISAIAAGTAATIYFDLIGSGPGNGSTVTVDNVRVTPENEFDSEFTPSTLAGPFVNVNRVLIEDVDGDQKPDIVATDVAGDKLLVFNGRGGLTFEREEIDLSGLGTGLVSLDAAPLTAGDGVSDLVVVAKDSNVVISPLSADEVGPAVALLTPAANQTNTGDVEQIELQFSESMRTGAVTDTDSVNNPNNYSVVFLGADDIADTSDDVTIDVVSVSTGDAGGVTPSTDDGTVTLELAAGSVPLADGMYQVVLNSSNLKDVSDNLLNDGASVVFNFTINNNGALIAPVAELLSDEGAAVQLNASFADAGGATPYTATINWGDGSTTDAGVVFNNGNGTIAAEHVYADNGTYDVVVSVADAANVSTQVFTTATVSNVAPAATVASGSAITVNQNELLDQVLVDFSDPGFSNLNAATAETFTASINWGDGTTSAGVVTTTAGGVGVLTTGNVAGQHTFVASGSYSVTVTVTDDDGGEGSATLTVEVTDVAAVLDTIVPVSGDEGSAVDLQATFTDGDSTGSYSATISWGDGSSSVGTVTITNGNGTIAGSHVYGDNGSYDISIDLTDAGGNVSTGVAAASIANVAPVIAVAADQMVTEGVLLNLVVGSFTDPGFTNDTAGTAETFTATIDWGDGTASAGVIALTVGSAGVATMGTISGEHTYAVAGDYTVSVTVSDDDGASDTGTLLVTVDADVPAIATVAPLTSDEGEQVTLQTTFTDGPSSGSYAATINWGDGTSSTADVTFDAGDGSLSGQHTYADNDIYNVSIELTDPTGNTAVSSTTATIANVAPTLVPAIDQVIDQGAELSLAVASFTDPGFDAADASTSETFTATIEWGDGTTTDGAITSTAGSVGVLTTGSVTGAHTFATAGSYTVNVTVTDDDGGVSTTSFTVDVADTPAVLNAPVPIAANEGATVSLQTAFTDQAAAGTYVATIDWGDGTVANAAVTFADGSGTVQGDHVYADNGSYNVSVELTDPAGNVVSESTTATIANVVPSLQVAADQTIDEGQTLNLTVGTFSDPGFTSVAAGTTETFVGAINWGDGTTSTGTVAITQAGGVLTLTEGAILGDHVYSSAGTFTVTLTLTDDDGGSVDGTFDVTVNVVDQAPVLSLIDPIGGTQDTPVNLTASFTDVGPGGTYTATITWGDGATSPGIVTFADGNGTIVGSHVYSDAGSFNVSVQVNDPAGNSAVGDTTASISPVTADTGVWLPAINFDTGAIGNELGTGEVITDQWADWGVHITTNDPVNHPAMIFDSANPTGGDTDLATPNIDFGGPGMGGDGGINSPLANSIAQNNILIISEDGDANDPDDNAAGGTLIFNFDNAVMLDEIRLLDIDNGESAFVRLYDGSGTLISSQSVIGSASGNGFHVVDLSATQVSRMEVELTGSGAITDVIFCRDAHATSPAVISGPATVNEGDSYQLSLDAPVDNVASWTIRWGDGSFDNLPVGSTSASHVYNDGLAMLPIIAYARTNDGNVYQSNEIEVDVLNIDPVLTIAGEASVEAGTVYTLNLSETDPGQDTIDRWVINWGDGTEAEVVEGDPDSVTHAYGTEGNYTISAEAFDEDSQATVQGSTLKIRARGSEGGEQFNLLIDGEIVASYTVSTSYQTYTYTSELPINATQVKIEFTNDVWDPNNGIDNNLIVDSIELGGQTYQTEASDVYSTGTWLPADGVQPGYRQSEWLHANGYFQFGAAFNADAWVPYVSNDLNVEVTATTSQWLPTIDFENRADHHPLTSGDVIAEQFAELGVHVTTNDPVNHPAMIFNSSYPSGGDADLGSPNMAFGGPGNGAGGQGGAGINNQSLGNILIVSEDANSSNPDDNLHGGTLIFTFDAPVMLDEIGLLDIDTNEAMIRLYNAAGDLIADQQVNGQGNNSYQRVALDASGVSRLEVEFTGSGAITDLEFCRDGHAIEPLPTKFYTVDGQSDRGFQYDAVGNEIADFDLVEGSVARGVTTTTDGNPVWVVKANEWVFVYDRVDNTYLGKWDAAGPEWARGIATDGDDIWVVDAYADRVYHYAGGAAWTSGTHNATSSFALHGNNYDPSGLEVFGDTLWVSDAGTDRVFVYNTDGSSLGNWHLDNSNAKSSGITTDVSGQHLWVTDYDDGEIYYYANAASLTSGTHSATSTIQLAANNQHPEGIADPIIPINFGDVVNDSISVAGEVDEWAFDGEAGKAVFVDFQSASTTVDYEIIAPSGAVIGAATSSSTGGLDRGAAVTETGQHRIVVRGVSGGTPSYQFQLFGEPEPDVQAITFGQFQQGLIEAPLAKDHWTFSVPEATDVFIDFENVTNVLRYELIGPDDNVVLSVTSGFLDRGIALPAGGDYRFEVRGQGANLPSYQLQLYLEPEPDVQALNFGDVASGVIEAPLAKDHWIFDGTAGSTIEIDFLSTNRTVQYELIAPDGSVAASASSSSTSSLDQQVVLTQSGQYRLETRGLGDILPTYQFRLVNVSLESSESINVGDIVEDQIAVAGQVDEWTFEAVAGQQISLDFQDLSVGGEVVDIEFYNADGNLRFTKNSANPDDLDNINPSVLAETGTYRMTVSARNGATGTYRFELLDADPITTVIAVGDVVDGEITVAGVENEWTFEAVAGQQVFFDFQDLSVGGEVVDLEIYNADGSLRTAKNSATPDGLDNINPSVLAEAGTYRVVISARNGAIGTYRFELLDANPRPIAIGDLVEGEITVAGLTNEWEFNATAGAAISLDFQDLSVGGNVVDLEFYRPDGSLRFAKNSASPDDLDNINSSILNQTGAYRIKISVRNGGVGTYRFELVDDSSGENTITIGDVVQGEISVADEVDTYVFDAVVGQMVFLDFQASSNNTSGITIQLIDPDGQTILSDNSTSTGGYNALDNGPLALGKTGEYQLIVDGTGTKTFTYQFELIDVPATVSQPIAIGDTVNGEIAVAGELNEYTFVSDGTDNVFLDFQASSNNTSGISIQLIDPDGQTVLTDISTSTGGYNALDNGPLTLDKAGEYRLTVDGAGTKTFTHQFELIDVPPTVPELIAIGDTVTGELAVAGEVDEYTFVSDGTDNVLLDFQASSNNTSGISIQLIDPDGQTVLTDISTSTGGYNALDNGPLELIKAGEYRLVVDGAGTRTFTYQFELIDVPEAVPQTIMFGDVVDGNIAVPGEINIFELSSDGTQSVFLDFFQSDVGNGNQTIELLAPDGSTVLTDVIQGAVPAHQSLDNGAVVLDQVGNYRLVVDGALDSTFQYRFQVVSVAAPEVISLPFDQIATYSIEARGQSVVYELAGVAGQEIYVDVLDLDFPAGEDAEVALLDPDGEVVFRKTAGSANGLDQGPLTLAKTGTYQLIATGVGDTLGSFKLAAWNIVPDVIQTITTNQTVVDLRVPTQSFAYQLEGTAGQELVFAASYDAISPDREDGLHFTLTAPSGATVFENRVSGQYLPPLPETGTYTLTVVGSDPADVDVAGDFRFRFMDVFEPTVSGETDSRGTEFWLGLPTGLTETNVFDLSLFVTSDVDTQAIISVPGLDFLSFADIAAGSVVEVSLPDATRLSGNGERTESRGIRVIAQDEVAVYGLSQENKSTDAFLGLPVDALGTDYIVASYSTLPVTFGANRPSQFGIVATVDNTTVTITPSRTFPGRPAGVPFDVTLNQGDVYQLQDPSSTGDVTGTVISSDQPIAVFGGHACAQVPVGTPACDYLIEQLPSVDTWGSEYLSVPLAVRTAGDRFRVLASADDTIVQINGQQVATLDRGEFYETTLTERSVISGNQPILAVQYSTGGNFDGTETDPFMLLLTPSEQFRARYTFTTLDDERFTTGHFVNVVVPAEGLASLTLDGAPVDAALFAPIGSSDFVGAQIQVPEGSHAIASDLPFGLTVYGFGDFDSYGYPGGTALVNIAEVTGIDTTPDVASVQVDETHVVSTLVTDNAGQPVSEILVNYQVTGSNPQSGFGITDENGVATFQYVGTVSGQDSIVSFVGNLIDTVTVDWQGVEPILTITSPVGGSQFETGSNQLLSGRVLPGAPDVEIVDVTINGQRVASLDPAGNYYGLIDIAAGIQTIEVIATDRLGNVVTESIELVGVDASPVEPAQFSEVAAGRATFEYARTSFNRQTNKLNVDYAVTNNGTPSIGNGSLALFHDFNPVSVAVDTPQGSVNNGGYFVLDAEVPATGLRTGQTSVPTAIKIDNPNRDRFDFTASVLTEQNAAPEFRSAPVVFASVDATYDYSAVAVDPNGQAVTYSLLTAPAGMTIDPATGQINWTPAVNDVASHDIRILADDGEGGTSVQPFTLTVTTAAPANRAPVFISLASDTFNLASVQPTVPGGVEFAYQFPVDAIDPENDTLTYSVSNEPSGLSIDPASGLIQWNVTAAEIGDYTFDILATDTAGNITTQSFSLSVVDQVPASIAGTVFDDANDNGLFDTGEVGLANRTVFLDANQNNQPDANETTTLTAADGTFAFTGLLAGSYAVGQVLETGLRQSFPATDNQTITVAAGETRGDTNFGVFNLGTNDQSAPEITSQPDRSAKVNREYGYQVAATDADGDTLNFSLLNAPVGMVIDAATGLIRWTPTAEQLSFQDVLVQVDDGNGNVDVQPFGVLVGPEFQAPSITSTPDLIATVDEAYEYAVVAEDPDNQLLMYDLVDGPTGASIDPITGLVMWTPTAADLGTASLLVSAVDTDGLLALQRFDLSIRNTNEAPVFDSTPILEATAAGEYRYVAVAVDSEDAVTYSLTDNPLGMQINRNTGEVLWTPTLAQIGQSIDVIVTATDERGLSTDQAYSISVVADTQAPVVSITNENTVYEAGDTYRFQVSYRDNVAVDNVVITLRVMDNPPQTITLDALQIGEFEITGPGFVNVTATVTDTSGNVGTATTRVRVIDPTDVTAPFAEINSPSNLDIVTYLTDISATVTSDADLDFWRVDYSLTGSGNWTTLATGTTDLDNQIVATFDPTLLANDSYDIRIFAVDFSGNNFTIANTVSIEGGAKLGNYATQFVDLSVPLAGIPIQITRQYDTLNVNESGDFGYGWRLGIGEAGLRESVPVGEAERNGTPALFGGSEPFYEGARVFITTPEGQRVSFTFEPEAQGGLLGTRFVPKFVSNDTDYTLEVENIPLSQRGDGTFGLYLFELPYNPRSYSLVANDGTRYNYDQFDGFQGVSNRNGVTLDYRDDGIFSSTGESITWTRDAQGRITEILDPAGNPLTYTYSESGDLLTFTDQVDNTWTNEYFADPAHYLKKITGPRGNTINEVQYDEDGRFVGLVDGLGNAVTQSYDLENNTFVQQDRNGNPTTLIYDDRGNITEEVDALNNSTLYEYNDPDNPRLETAITDGRGNTTRFEYDSRGNVTLLEEPGGIFTRFEYDSFNNVTRTIGPATSNPGDGYADTLLDSFFANGVILGTTIGERLDQDPYREIDSADIILGPEFNRDTQTQSQSDFIRLEAGDYVTVGFDELVIDRAGDDIFVITPAFGGTFADEGLMADVSVTTDGTNFVSIGQIEIEAFAGLDLADAGITDPVLGVRVTALATDDGNADNDIFVVTGVQTALGDFRTTRNIYDQRGNLVESIDALGNSQLQTVDSFGRPLTIIDRNGNTTTLEYDQLIGSPTKVINPDLSEQTFTYDSLGRPLTQTNELGVQVQQITYDDSGRRLTVAGADGQLTTNVYDSDLLLSETVKISDTRSQVTTYEYDDNNRLFQQTDAIGGVVELTYDANGNVLSLTDPVGNETSYIFDALDRQIEETDPLGQITTYDYDAVGNLTEKIDRLGRRIEFQYDQMDRQTAELWYAADDTLIETSTYTYDIFSNLLTADDAESSYAYTYDDLDRLTTSDNAGTPDAPNVILTYGYDANGNRVSVEDNSGVTIDSEYGSRNQLLSKTWFGGEVDAARIEYDFDAALREIEAARYSDVTGSNQIGSTETTYDDTGRRVQITHLDGSDIVLANYEYEFDNANRITRQVIDDDIVDYGYDATGQLLTADHSDPAIPDEFYRYDLNGNRLESHLHGTGYVTGPNNQLLSDGEFNYEYDDEGNQILRTNAATGETTEFEYDHRNRLVKVTVKTNGGIITSESQFVFDVFGRRVAVINDADGAGPLDAVRENFVYDGDNVWADYNEVGEAIARYLFGEEIDSNIARWRVGEGTAWYLTDHLGTVRGIADAVGTLANQTTFDSFGQVLNETNALFGDRYKFTGRELNSGNDYYYRARQYNASSGRFGSLDPIGFEGQQSNLFSYTSNSPIVFTDPDGRLSVENVIVRVRTFLDANPIASLGVAVACSFARVVGFAVPGALPPTIALPSIPVRTFCALIGR